MRARTLTLLGPAASPFSVKSGPICGAPMLHFGALFLNVFQNAKCTTLECHMLNVWTPDEKQLIPVQCQEMGGLPERIFLICMQMSSSLQTSPSPGSVPKRLRIVSYRSFVMCRIHMLSSSLQSFFFVSVMPAPPSRCPFASSWTA